MNTRKLLLIGCLLTALVVSLTGTLAYLTDTDSDVNVMTLGNVDIVQTENGEEGFHQSQPLYPAYYEGEPDASANGAVEKRVNVQNVGESDAYIRTVFAFEAGELSKEEFEANLHLLWNVDEAELNWVAEKVTIRDEQYYLAWYAYPDAVNAGTEAGETLMGVVMDKGADSDVMNKLGDKDYKILVVSQAVQTANLDTLFAAEGSAGVLDTAFGELSETSHPWMDWDGKSDEEGDQAPDGTAFVSNAEELAQAIKDGAAEIVLIDDIVADETTDFMFKNSNGAPWHFRYNDVTLFLNGHSITVEDDALLDGKNYANGGLLVQHSTLNIVGEGSINTENQSIGVYGWANSNINIYGGTYTGNASNRNESAIYVNNANVVINVYGGDFTKCDYAFNVYNKDCPTPVIILHEGIEFRQFLKNGTDLVMQDINAGRIAVADGCTLETSTVDGVVWYKVVKE